MTEEKSPPRKSRAIKPGKLRERVKAGKLHAKDVLSWLRRQKYQSESLARWLQRFNLETYRAESAREEEASNK